MGLMYLFGFSLMGVFMAFGIPIAVDLYRARSSEKVSGSPALVLPEPTHAGMANTTARAAEIDDSAIPSTPLLIVGESEELAEKLREALKTVHLTYAEIGSAAAGMELLTSSATREQLEKAFRLNPKTFPKFIERLRREGFLDEVNIEDVQRALRVQIDH